MLNQFKLGEGLVGQCALEKEKILLLNVPRDYITITSGLGEAPPLNIIVIPVLFEGHVKAVLELASFERLNPTHQTFLDQLAESIGIVLNTIEANTRTEDLLKQSQSLARELQSQQEELQETNAALGEKARLLAEQNVEVERKNREVEQARQALEEKARQLALTSKYKSEFLANMSHELRTPLNSLLILSDQLSRNPENNLTGRQVDFAKTIHSAGNDLLSLINDILDLSKIESGTVHVEVDDVWFSDLIHYVERTFRHVADAKRLTFNTVIGKDLPRAMQTDAKRLQQVLKNLLSNAFKFTERGGVTLEITTAASGWSPDHETLSNAHFVVSMSVVDTGIGIQPDKQQIIFEAFQQADGSTSRKYGGTGLGLAISRELAQLLGGEIKLVSMPGKGSMFTLYVPLALPHAAPRARLKSSPVEPTIPEKFITQTSSAEDVGRASEHDTTRTRVSSEVISTPPRSDIIQASTRTIDDRDSLQPEDRVILIVEDDAKFAQLLLDAAHDNGFRAVIATSGGIALTLVREIKPHGITLDIFLPDIDGWGVIERVKEDVSSRHVPVEIISTGDERMRGLRMGASGVLCKPVKTRETIDVVFNRLRSLITSSERRVAVVEPDEIRRREIVEIIRGSNVTIDEFTSGSEAFAKARTSHFHALIMGMNVHDMRGFELAVLLERDPATCELPIIAFSLEQPPSIDETHLVRMSHTRVLRYVRSLDQLYDEVALALHRPFSEMPPERQAAVERMHRVNAVLAQRKVLIVDDDIRNIFALTTLLEPHGMTIISAETGKAAIEALESSPDIDIVLMDIMMPEMDGYDTIRAIRERERFRALPIIALTAKAMKGDREKCIEAGATDYISKPVDVEHLLATLRIWLHRGLSQTEVGGY